MLPFSVDDLDPRRRNGHNERSARKVEGLVDRMVRGSSSLPGRISKQLCGVLATLRSASEKARIVSMAAARSSPDSARRLLALEAMERLAPARHPYGSPIAIA